MRFFVSRHERLEASTEDSKVAGFKSVACRRPELGMSAVPNPAAEAATLFGCFTGYCRPMNDPLCVQLPKWLLSTISLVCPPAPLSFWTQGRSPFDFQPLECNFTFPLKWRRGYHVNTSQPDPRFVLPQPDTVLYIVR